MEQNLSAFADRVLEAAAKAGIAPAEVACSRDESFIPDRPDVPAFRSR